MDDYILEMRNITKEFPGVKALDHVSFNVKRGEIHALCGENGAGKSTLMKVLSGVYPSRTYAGDIVINGKVMEFEDIRASEKAGIAIIYQELALVKDLDVAENIYLGNLAKVAGIVQWNKVYFDAGKLLEEIGLGSLEIDLSSKIKDIGIGHQQLVEIAKALSKKADILILDEPTAALTETEVDLLMKILGKLRSNGVTCILISHKLNELFAISDRITILRDGNSIGTYETREVDEEKVIALMVGRQLTQRYPEKGGREIGDIVLEVKGYSHYRAGDRSRKVLDNINFNVRRGEILGMAGLMGAGRTELLCSLFGFLRGHREGEVLVSGMKVEITSPLAAISNGIGMVTEDRKRYGLVLMQGVKENVTLASLGKIASMGVISEYREISETNLQVKSMNIKTPSVETAVNTLSGGNQQKILLARCLMTKPKLLFLDEPTRGIDVGAKYEIYLLMKKLAENGTAIVMASSELPEIIGMSDRVIVMHEGEISGEFARGEITQEAIMRKASGGNAA